MSQNMVVTDAMLHPILESTTQNTPPEMPVVGQQYALPTGSTGLWTGFDECLATYTENGWAYVPLLRGLRARVVDMGAFFWWDGEQWQGEPVSALDDLEKGTRYDIGVSVGYEAEPFENLLTLPIVQPMALPKDAPGSLAIGREPPAEPVTMNLRRNGNVVGQVVFGTRDFRGTFSVPDNVMFAAGDLIAVDMGLVSPETFKGYGLVIRMNLIAS